MEPTDPFPIHLHTFAICSPIITLLRNYNDNDEVHMALNSPCSAGRGGNEFYCGLNMCFLAMRHHSRLLLLCGCCCSLVDGASWQVQSK